MSQIRRYDEGPVRVDVRLIDGLWWALGMDQAPPRSRVKPLADRVRAEFAAYRDPADNAELVAEVEKLAAELPVYPLLLEVDAMQRLRGWHRLRYGTVTVEAEWLCEVRNLVDSLTLSLGSSCEEELEDLRDEGLDDLAAVVAAAIAEDRPCGECDWCRFLVLRDQCDDALDASGHYGNSTYQAYKRRKRADGEAATAAGKD